MLTKNACAHVLVIVGAGGHGKVVGDAVLCGDQMWQSVYATDAQASKCHGSLLPGIAMVDRGKLEALANVRFHIAVGNNTHREREMRSRGVAHCVSLVHPHASVSRFAVMQNGCFVAASAVVAPMAQLGLAVIVNHAAVVDHDCFVGDFSHIAPQATLGGDVHIGHSVLVGAGAVVLPGRCVADGVTIGAGAVVVHDLDQPGIYAGVPAKRIK
jgi:sugar O-acyltransferase (sialic acid O-acetyltransferase NeuD family)